MPAKRSGRREYTRVVRPGRSRGKDGAVFTVRFGPCCGVRSRIVGPASTTTWTPKVSGAAFKTNSVSTAETAATVSDVDEPSCEPYSHSAAPGGAADANNAKTKRSEEH